MSVLPPPGPEFTRVKDCDLCRALKLTPWFFEDEICWIAECEICETPMVVWRSEERRVGKECRL